MSALQWIALVILTTGCIIQRIGYPDDQEKATKNRDSQNVPNNQDLTNLLEYVLRKTEIFWIILQVHLRLLLVEQINMNYVSRI